MKTARQYSNVIISNRAYKRQEDTRHPWVYDNEIIKTNGTYQNGELIDVMNEKGTYIGTGFINENSKIRVRIISRNANDVFDEAFWERRLRYAIEFRKTVMDEDFSCCRLIFGEADAMPGFTVDRYNNILVTQVLSLGIEKIKPLLFNLLYKIMNEKEHLIDGIFERNDVKIRELEGLTENKGFFKLDGIEIPSETTTTIIENGIKYKVDFENGQKTGFFLDQKYNRKAIQKISKNKKVLDCFTHTGSFGLNAAVGGAEKVTSVDISESAIEMAKENGKANGLEDKIDYEVADVFDLLKNLPSKKYDFIILDPPAFTKSRNTINNAFNGYKEINYLAMKALPRGGYLATCSCSHFMENNNFKKMLEESAWKAGVELKQVEERQQSSDHPILWNVPETNYLKFYIFQIV